ncbi:MAG TPA: hypothetical protein VG796_28200 [Verrucomicrobiales bacterium]|nr:hypothetical protein [Verrucomicrobiales bacterium]
MKPLTQYSLALTAFAVSAFTGWLVNRPAAAEQKAASVAAGSAESALQQAGGVHPPGGVDAERSSSPQLIPPKSGGKWFAVACGAFEPGNPMRCGSGLGVQIFDGITPGSASAEQWAAAPKSKEEFEAVKKLLTKTRAALARVAPPPVLVKGPPVVSFAPPESFTWRIDPFDAGTVKQDFLQELAKLLGEERAAVLVTSSRNFLDTWLFSFGQTPTEFTIAPAGPELTLLHLKGGQSVRGSAIDFWAESYPPLAKIVAEAEQAWKAAKK